MIDMNNKRVVVIGAVIKSCSVFVLLSSLNVFIVRIGRIMRRTKSIIVKYAPVSLDESISVLAPKAIADKTRATARNTYPVEVVK